MKKCGSRSLSIQILNNSDFFSYDFSFKLSAITRFWREKEEEEEEEEEEGKETNDNEEG